MKRIKLRTDQVNCKWDEKIFVATRAYEINQNRNIFTIPSICSFFKIKYLLKLQQAIHYFVQYPVANCHSSLKTYTLPRYVLLLVVSLGYYENNEQTIHVLLTQRQTQRANFKGNPQFTFSMMQMTVWVLGKRLGKRSFFSARRSRKMYKKYNSKRRAQQGLTRFTLSQLIYVDVAKKEQVVLSPIFCTLYWMTTMHVNNFFLRLKYYIFY